MLDIILFGVLLLILLAFIFKGIVIVRPTHKAIVERLGKYRTVLEQGFHIIIPFIDKAVSVNITEQMVDADPQEVITNDNLNARVDAQVYFQVKEDIDSIKKSQYNVYNYRSQIVALSRTTLRDIIGKMNFKDVNNKRDVLNDKLATELDVHTDAWGIKIVRTELKEIEPPQDVQDTMNKVMKAENEKIAAKDFAIARETEADGVKKAEIKRAEGIATAITLKADADARAIRVVSDSAEKHFKDRAERQKQLEVLRDTLSNNTKYVIPSNSGFLNILGLSGGDSEVDKTIGMMKGKYAEDI